MHKEELIDIDSTENNKDDICKNNIKEDKNNWNYENIIVVKWNLQEIIGNTYGK